MCLRFVVVEKCNEKLVPINKVNYKSDVFMYVAMVDTMDASEFIESSC
jgi:hypothetical protein